MIKLPHIQCAEVKKGGKEMKKKFFTAAAMAGFLAVSGLPMGVAAQEVDVQYVAGGAVDPTTPPDYQGMYYVLLPANVTFTDSSKSRAMDVELKANDGDVSKLPSELKVDVAVTSANTYTLESASVQGASANYSLTYGQTTMDATNTKVGQLTPGTSKITGTAELTSEVNMAVPNGTVLSDTLTYTVSHVAPK